jgi:phosphoribosyl-ATP pyrophosphohydrolase/phosphoribosyl-AMP cyclohydrolase
MNVDFQKYTDGLVPTIVQDDRTQRILMLGFMNREALELTLQTGKATFYSRSKQRLWTKGETSGNFLLVKEVKPDCDSDTLLIRAVPNGPVCHTGKDTCFGEQNEHEDFLFKLEKVIRDRKENPRESSYTARLFSKGLNKIAQKVGEEAVELVIEAKDSDDERFRDEAADLLYHFLVLLSAKNVKYSEILDVLNARHSEHKV